MKKYFILSLLILSSAFGASASGWSLSDLLGGLSGDNSNVVTNVIEGVLTRTNISVEDMAGHWTATGSAVSFKSENFLAKAGGVAAAAAVESKLDPYYKQYGLTGAVFDIEKDGSFVMTVKSMKLKGTITKNDDNTFEFNFAAFGVVKIGSLTAYVQKAPGKLEVMFDATKLKGLISAVAQFSGMELAKTAAKVLDQYEGLCVGFALSGTSSNAVRDNDKKSSSGSSSDSRSSGIGSGLGGLLDKLSGKNK